MAEAALALYALYMALAFGLRTLLHWRATGSSGFHGVSGTPGSAEWFAGLLFVVATALGLAAPVLALLDAVPPIAAFDVGAVNWTGLGLALMVPSVVALVGFAALVVALELQVRLVEEPYLLEQHGEAYRAYARRTGRFVPGVGRLERG